MSEDYCYLCGVILTKEKKHKEHIIQNAIGGTLKPDNILCIDCGAKLGELIDVPFVKIFENITTRLNIKKDRDNKNKVINGTINDLEISWDNLKATPRKPFYQYDPDTKKLKIFAHKKVAKNYRLKIVKEIGEGNISDIEEIDDISYMGPILFQGNRM